MQEEKHKMRKPGARPDHVDLPAEPLLNEEQRAALDAALAKKRLEQGQLMSLSLSLPVTQFFLSFFSFKMFIITFTIDRSIDFHSLLID